MAAITKGTECYVKLPGELRVYETTEFPGNKRPLQTFYGDLDGAAEAPKDMIYQIGDYLGDALGEIVIDQGAEYQLISCNVTVRENGTVIWIGFRGPGKYYTERRPIYVKSSDISVDKELASQQKYQRENADKIAQDLADKKKQDLIDSLANNNNSSPETGNNQTGTGLNITSIVVVVFAFLGLIIGGVLWWKSKQNKKAVSTKPTNN